MLDSPFADMRDVVATALRRHHVPPWPVLAASDRVTRLLYGFYYRDVRPVKAIADFPARCTHSRRGRRIIPVAHARGSSRRPGSRSGS